MMGLSFRKTAVPLTRNQLKKLKSLRTRKGRHTHGLFLAEGVRLLEAALRYEARPETVYYGSGELNERTLQVVRNFRSAGVRCEEVPPHQLEAFADTERPQGIVALFQLPDTRLREIFRPDHERLVICDGVSDPGNLGTLIRSARAFDFELLILTGASADPFSPKVVRATVGSLFGMEIARSPSEELLRFLNEGRFQLIGTSGRGDPDPMRLETVIQARRLALAIGSEHRGLRPEIIERCEINWRIRHREDVESLNAAVAGSIVMKEVYDARRKLEK